MRSTRHDGVRRTRHAALVLLVLGCGPGGDAGADPPALALEETIRIGTVDGEHTALNNVVDVVETARGIVLLEASPARVARFAHTGDFVASFGRDGDGPGELRSPVGLQFHGGDLWVADRAGRLERFTWEGRPVESHRHSVPAPDSGVAATPRGVLEDGSILSGPGSYGIGAVLEGTTRFRSFVRTTAEGEVLNEIVRVPIPSTDFFVGNAGGDRVLMGGHPLQAGPLVEPLPDGSGVVALERWVAEGRPAVYRVRVIDIDGTERHAFEAAYDPVAEPNWLDRILAERAERSPDAPDQMMREVGEVLRENVEPRPFHPPVTDLVPGHTSMWIRREDLGRDSVPWDVFTLDGTPLGTADLPRSVRVVRPMDDHIWAVVRDELDVPYLVRFAVEREP